MIHCWTERYAAMGFKHQVDAELAELTRRWPNGVPEDMRTDDPWEHYRTISSYVSETCMLEDGHDGPHEFQDISDWQITFAAKEATR